MKKIIAACSMMILSVVMIAQSEYSQFTRDIRIYSGNYSDNQVIGLYENHYGLPQNTLLRLFSDFGYNWGNVSLGLEISNFLGVPVGDLLGIYRQYPEGNGWGVMAQRYGIKPGSPEFHRMKAMMNKRKSYWKDIYGDYRTSRNPAVARRNRIHINEGLIRIGTLSSKEMKQINKEIEKRNKVIGKRDKKMMKGWEKENKKAQKQRGNIGEKQKKRMKKIGVW